MSHLAAALVAQRAAVAVAVAVAGLLQLEGFLQEQVGVAAVAAVAG